MKLNFKDIPKYCISLKRSAHRRLCVKEEFEKHGMEVDFFDAVDRNDLVLPELSTKENTGIYACMLSHLELMKMALAKGHEAICAFEDDVCLVDDFNERIKYIESLEGFDFDLFSLGGHFSTDVPGSFIGCCESTQWNHIFKTYAMGGSYGYIITKKVMEFCVRNLTYMYGIDQFLSDVVYKRFGCFSFVPFLVGCVPCVSEITGQYWEYKNICYYYNNNRIEDFNEPFVTDATIEADLQKVKDYKIRKKWEEDNA